MRRRRKRERENSSFDRNNFCRGRGKEKWREGEWNHGKGEE